jgi:hypothetical protein
LRGLDSDNGAEFINAHLFAWCEEQQITFTRSRPYRKNDNCFVEQKNWPIVRQLIGYGRYDTPAELEVLRELYGHLRLYVNFFQPQMKLGAKTRHGAKLRKRFDTARTPHQRVLASPQVSRQAKRTLTRTYRELNPAELKRQIGSCQDRLIELAASKPELGKEVGYPSGHPFKRDFSWKEISRTSLLRQPAGASRTS